MNQDLKLICKFCGGIIYYPPTVSGNTVPCPHCQKPTFLNYQDNSNSPQLSLAAVSKVFTSQNKQTAYSMKPVWLMIGAAIAVILIVIIAVMFFNFPTTTDDKQKQPALPVNKASKPIIVKGLYIGMRVQELPDVVSSTLGSPWRIDRTDNPKHITILNDVLDTKQFDLICAHDPAAEEYDTSIYLWLDADDRVEQILIGQKCCNQLFNSQDLSAEDFAQIFIDAYGIKEMKQALTEKNLLCWEYTSPDNIRFRIYPNKVVNISKIMDKIEVQKNFD
jgi:hypothetical protein